MEWRFIQSQKISLSALSRQALADKHVNKSRYVNSFENVLNGLQDSSQSHGQKCRGQVSYLRSLGDLPPSKDRAIDTKVLHSSWSWCVLRQLSTAVSRFSNMIAADISFPLSIVIFWSRAAGEPNQTFALMDERPPPVVTVSFQFSNGSIQHINGMYDFMTHLSFFLIVQYS